MKQASYPEALYPFVNKRMNIGGNDIHYVDEGEGDAILFCHPSISTSFMYRRLIPKLSSTYRCVAFDFPGFGLSIAIANYVPSILAQSAIVRGIVQQLKLQNIYLVVQEIGGHAALIALQRSPEMVKGIILTDTIIFPVSEYSKISSMLEIINGKVFNLFNVNFNFFIRAFCRFGIRKRKLSIAEKKVYKDLFDTRVKRRLITRMLYQLKVEETLMMNIKTSFETTFKHTPVLLIYGDEDPIAKLGIPERIHSMLPNSSIHFILGEAHFPHEGAPDEMVSIIEKWIKRVYA